MNELKLTGGARIGMANVKFPFVTLKVDKDCLELNASLIGNLIFQASDIISIESITGFIRNGIKINHRVSTYKDDVVFWSSKDPNLLIRQIEETGFLNNINKTEKKIDHTIIEKQAKGGSPIKRGFAIGVTVVWNLLFLIDFIPHVLGERNGIPIGNGVLTALGFSFLTALLILISKDFRRLVLKEGRELKDIKKSIIFAMIISGTLLLHFGIMINYELK